MKILGIGNAIVDVICKIDEQYLKNNELTKGTMKLVDEVEFKRLLSTLKNCLPRSQSRSVVVSSVTHVTLQLCLIFLGSETAASSK